MNRTMLLILAIVGASVPGMAADTLYDPGLPGRLGVVVRPGSNTVAIVQPFQTRTSGWAELIGIAMASGADPNQVGFRVTLTDTKQVTEIPGTPIAGPWNFHPVAGTTLAYTYVEIGPVFLSGDEIYGLAIEPGDQAMYGSVAYSVYGGLGWGTSDNWATSYRLPLATCIRVYGAAVIPEPACLSALASLLGLALLRRRAWTVEPIEN